MRAPSGILRSVLYYPQAITRQESDLLVRDFEPKLNRKKFAGNHFDSVIKDYREMEMSLPRWSPESQTILHRLFTLAFQHQGKPKLPTLLPPHVLELKPDTGEILPHVDSVKHGGDVVAVLSLLSKRRLLLTEPEGDYVSARLPDSSMAPGTVLEEMEVDALSMYVLSGTWRYNVSHAICKGPERRVSIVFRDAPAHLPDWL